MTIVGIVVLLLILRAAPTYADTNSVDVVNIYELSREYYTKKEVYDILGVSVTVELTVPKLLVNGENYTFTYRVLIGDAPSGWALNITEVYLDDGVYGDCFRRSVQRPTIVLKGGESLTGQFKTEVEGELIPGSFAICYPRVIIRYLAKFGVNWRKDEHTVSGTSWIKSRELPLELGPNISTSIERANVVWGVYDIRLNGGIKIRNIWSWDIILTGYKGCVSTKAHPESIFHRACGLGQRLSSIVLKPGEEYVIRIDDSYTFYHEPPWYVAYIIEYLYPDGRAENWIVLRLSGVTSAVGTREAKSPTTATATTMTTRTEPAEPLPGVAVGSAMRAAESGIALALTLAPIALVAIAAIAYAARRRSRVVPVPPSQPEQPTPGMAEPQRAVQPRPPPLPEMGARVSAILSKLASARTRLDMGEVNDAILDLHKAVNATISLILEAEGLSAKRPNGRELTMREKFRLLAGRGWVGRGSARHFARLQALRNRIEHYPERIHAPQATASEAEGLLRFHEDFVRASLRRLGATASTEGDEGGEKPHT
jgi:hypothetical protein